MAKLFFAGIAIFVLIVVGVFSVVLTPLMVGVSSNLGGSPKSPFQAPVPGSVSNAVHDMAQQATPSVLLTGALALAALLLIYLVGNLIGHWVLQGKASKKRWAELRWRARASAARQVMAGGKTADAPAAPTSAVASPAEIDALWE